MKNYCTLAYILLLPLIVLFCNSCELIVIRQPYTVIKLTDIDQKSPNGLVMLVKRELDSLNTTAVLNLMLTSELKPLNGIEKFSILSSVQRLQLRSKGKELYVNDVRFSQNSTAATVSGKFNQIEPIEFSVVKNNERWYVTSWK
jgi:hypothetical protein